MRFPACGRQVSLHFISLPMTDSFFLSFRSRAFGREIYQFEEISPRTLVEMTALMRLSVIHSLFPFKKWVNSQNDNELGLEKL